MRQHTGSSPTHPLCYPILRRLGRTTTTRSWPKYNVAKAITMWQPMFVCMLPLMQLFLHHMLIGSDRQEYMRPPPPPLRNGTVIWNCHMGGDPNPKGGGVMRQMRNFFWCICSHSRKACLPIQRQSILRVHWQYRKWVQCPTRILCWCRFTSWSTWYVSWYPGRWAFWSFMRTLRPAKMDT
jgi:hypothetical protein